MSYRTSVEPLREDSSVRSALKAALTAELAMKASTSKGGETATPEHLASPGRLHTRLRA